MATAFYAADDGSLPGSEEEKKKLLEYWNLFNLDQYYYDIEKDTFATTFLPISRDEVKAFLLYLSGKLKPNTSEEDLINAMIKRLETAFEGFKSGTFVKLSTRSPKDAVDKLDRTVQILAKNMKEEPNRDNNTLLMILRKSFFESMKVNNAEEAMDIFSRSSRTVSDLRRALDLMSPENWSLQIVLREFVYIPPGMEFRGFVYKKQLNAISQYDSALYVDAIIQNKDQIRSNIMDLYSKVSSSVKYENYIIDFAVLEDLSVKIVEINPWGESTGSGLFSWKDDLEKLQSGFEFRTVDEKLDEKTLEGHLMAWNQLIKSAQAQEGSSRKEEEKSKRQGRCVMC